VSKKTIKKLLLSLIAVGIIGSVTARSTFAILTSGTSNANTSASTGTLTFSNTVGTGTACQSFNGTSNVNTGCDPIMTASTGTWFPLSSNSPASTEYPTAKVTIKNSGSLAASALSLYMASCAASTTTGAPSPGGTNPCCPGGTFPCATGSLDFMIQEMTDATFTTALNCWWPTVAAGACSFNDAGLVDSLGNFYGSYHDNTHSYSLGTGPAATVSRYFEIILAEPVNASNGLQGETATFALYWHMAQ
jgi:hypothetical protein